MKASSNRWCSSLNVAIAKLQHRFGKMCSATSFGVSCFLCAIISWNFAMADQQASEENRPYEFAFNIVDFQHRFEKKDSDGIITGEYGFITGDGVYHETGYATDKNGDFIITRMSYRRIKSSKDAQEIFKDRPEAAKKLVEAIARACSACKVATKADNDTRSTPTVNVSASRTNFSPILKEMTKTLTGKQRDDPTKTNEIPEDSKDLSNQRRGKSLSREIPANSTDSRNYNFTKTEETTDANVDNSKANDREVQKMPNDLYYRFNYTITSHGHQEDGYRSGAKAGSYRAQSENGVDTRVKYLSNEFGHQPNVSFVPNANAANESQRLKGNSFLWYWS